MRPFEGVSEEAAPFSSVSQPLKRQYQHACSPHCSYGTSCENLLTDQDTSSLVIISSILMTCMFDQVMMLQGEIRCLSLLGLKGLNP